MSEISARCFLFVGNISATICKNLIFKIFYLVRKVFLICAKSDTCGGQYFSFDEAEKDEVYQFLTSYFANIGGKINIADNKLTFTVDKA